MNANFQKIIDEYPEDYCDCLESAYGEHMMSEGGTIAINRMFVGTELQNKSLLDIGFGLGAAVFYLAKHYQAKVTGIEINPWMVEEATRRTPENLRANVQFVKYQQPPLLPFADQSFDVVYSKGVLVHLEDKAPLFQEIYRVLKPTGCLIIDDWLSPKKNQWGERLQKMCIMENLTLFAQTELDYKTALKIAGFTDIQQRDENNNYTQYNLDIIRRLNQPEIAKAFQQKFGNKQWQEAIEAYKLIADSIQDQELLIRWFKALKK